MTACSGYFVLLCAAVVLQQAADGFHFQLEQNTPSASGGQGWFILVALTQPSTRRECGNWIEEADFYGFDLINVDAQTRQQCRQACQSQAGCNAVTHVAMDANCYLKQIPEGYEHVDNAVGSAMQLCADETIPGPLLSENSPSPAPGRDSCGEWLWDHTIVGTEVPHEDTSPVTDRHDCLNRCVNTRPCNTALFNYREKMCYLHDALPGTQPLRMPNVEVLRFCEAETPIECGVWQVNDDFTGYDLQGVRNSLQVNGAACAAHCRTLARCNAVVFKKFRNECWPKSVPEDGLWAEPIENSSSDSYLLCDDEILATKGRKMNLSTTAVVGIAIAALVVAAACSAAFVVLLLASSRRQKHSQRKIQQEALDTVHSSYFGITAVTSGGLGSTSVTGSGACPYRVNMAANFRPMSGSCGGERSVPIAAGGHTGDDILHALVQMQNVTKSSTTEVTSATAELFARTPYGQSPRFLAEDNQFRRKARTRGTSTAPTTVVHRTREMSVLPVPGQGAPKDQLMDFLHNQLDCIEAIGRKGRQAELLEGLHMSGSGPHDRLEGGQAIVQMVHSNTKRLEYAVKFFVSRRAFEQEKALYARDNPLHKFLPQVLRVIDNDDRQLVDPSGNVLPPCIAMERGESLDLWSQRNGPDRAQAFTVIYHIAQRMMEFHAAGYVHRDLKPGNVMWLPRTNRWTVIDFGCAARHRELSSIGYTLRYAAPEVIRAKRSGEHEMVVKESLDAWSLGVMAFEMCTGTTPFPRGSPSESIMDQIEGVNGEILPWEGERLTPQARAKLRLFQDSLLQLLHRDPQQRPSMRQFCRTCAQVLGEHSVVDGKV